MIIGLQKSCWDGKDQYLHLAVAFPDRVVDNPFPFRDAQTGGILLIGRDAEWYHDEKDCYLVLGESETIGSSLEGLKGLCAVVARRLPQMRRPEDRDFRVFGFGKEPTCVPFGEEELEAFRRGLRQAGYEVRE